MRDSDYRDVFTGGDDELLERVKQECGEDDEWVKVTLPLSRLIAIIGCAQLGLRHPLNNSATSRLARESLEGLIHAIAPTGALRELLDRGFGDEKGG